MGGSRSWNASWRSCAVAANVRPRCFCKQGSIVGSSRSCFRPQVGPASWAACPPQRSAPDRRDLRRAAQGCRPPAPHCGGTHPEPDAHRLAIRFRRRFRRVIYRRFQSAYRQVPHQGLPPYSSKAGTPYRPRRLGKRVRPCQLWAGTHAMLLTICTAISIVARQVCDAAKNDVRGTAHCPGHQHPLDTTHGPTLRAGIRTDPARHSETRRRWHPTKRVGRVGGRPAWLHAFVSPRAPAYEIDPTRGHKPAKQLLGLDWSGTLVHDGWSVYDRFRQAFHQQCGGGHLQRRCQNLLGNVRACSAVRLPRPCCRSSIGRLALRRAWRGHRLNRDDLAMQGLALSCVNWSSWSRAALRTNRIVAWPSIF